MSGFRAFTAILIIILLMPTTVGHGANSYSFIMRNQSLQPSEAQVLDNDTMIFYNAAEINRTILIDRDGDSIDDVECQTGPSNTSSITDECRIWLEPGKWSPGEYEVRIMSNSSLWNTLILTILLDNHTETSSFDLAGPSGYSFNNDLNNANENEARFGNIYQIGLFGLLIVGLVIWKRKGIE